MSVASQFIKPDRRRPMPLWHQTEQAIRSLIDSGEWGAGAQIPNEDRLCTLLGVSRITLRHALRNIEESGLIRREHGRGTFVRSGTVVAGARGLTSFTQEMAGLGLVASTRVLEAGIVPASAQMADALDLEIGTPIVTLRRLRLGNDVPVGIQTAHLPAARVPALLESGLGFESLYGLLRNRYGIEPREAREVYRVGAVSEADAGPIQLPAGSPAFLVERIAYDARGPFELTLSTMRGDRYEIRSTLRI